MVARLWGWLSAYVYKENVCLELVYENFALSGKMLLTKRFFYLKVNKKCKT